MYGRFSPPAGGDLLCPWRLVVAMAQATFSWPFGPIHLESACLHFRLAAKTVPAPLFLLFPANPLRWASPGVTMDWEKRHRGRLRMSASRSYSPSLSPLAFGHLPLTRGVGPGPPLRECSPACGAALPARKIRSAWVRFHPGHRALSAQNLPLVRFNFCAWVSPPTLPARILLRPKPSPCADLQCKCNSK